MLLIVKYYYANIIIGLYMMNSIYVFSIVKICYQLLYYLDVYIIVIIL